MAGSPIDPLPLAIRSSAPLLGRLSLMMFLQYFVQGAYLPIASIYVENVLQFSSFQVGCFGAALSVGPVLAPFVIGQFVDRFFSTERVMAFCHLVGGVLMLLIAVQQSFWPVIVLGTLYSILYVPTMMLSNSVAFQHLKNSDLEFPWIRMFGTLGYIVPAYIIELWWLRGLTGPELEQARVFAFTLSGIAGIALAVYCLSLPHTPPADKKSSYAPWIVVRMLAQRDFLILVLVSFLIAIAHNFIVIWFGPFLNDILGDKGAYEQSISSVGQICEVLVLLGLGLLIKQLGFKRTMLLGLTAYLVRCLLYALVFQLDPPFWGKIALATTAQALHGFCFGCFLAVGYMYVDRIAPPDVRGSMQTLYGVFVIALGFFAGSILSGSVHGALSAVVNDTKVSDWPSIWLSCAAVCAVCLILFALFFPDRHLERAADQKDRA